MNRTIFLLTVAAILATAFVVLGWDTSYHVLFGGLLLLPIAVIRMVSSLRSRASADSSKGLPSRLEPSALFVMIRAALTGGLCVAYLALGFWILGQSPLASWYHDHDQGRLDQELSGLEVAGQFEQAASRIELRFQEPLSNESRQHLARRWHRNLLAAGKTVPAREGIPFFLKAIEVAHRFDLEHEQDQWLLACARTIQDYQKSIADCRDRSDWPALVEVLERVARSDLQSQEIPVGLLLTEAYLNWAESEADVEQQQLCLQLAGSTAERYGLAAQREIANLRWQALAARRRQSTLPRALPPTTQAGILRVRHDSWPPVLSLECWVESERGVPLTSLENKDFRVLWGGRSVSVQMAPVKRSPEPAHLVLAMDCSGSMHDALDESREAARTFLRALDVGTSPVGMPLRFKVLTFGDTVSSDCDWTERSAVAIQAISRVQAGGGTALYKALETALNALGEHTGPRRIVLFTDGSDTQGGPDLKDLLTRAHKEHVSISIIGLRTEALRTEVLRDIAARTGGSFGEATKPQELAEQYLAAARLLRAHCYRLVLTPDDRPKAGETVQLEVQIGNPALTLTQQVELP